MTRWDCYKSRKRPNTFIGRRVNSTRGRGRAQGPNQQDTDEREAAKILERFVKTHISALKEEAAKAKRKRSADKAHSLKVMSVATDEQVGTLISLELLSATKPKKGERLATSTTSGLRLLGVVYQVQDGVLRLAVSSNQDFKSGKVLKLHVMPCCNMAAQRAMSEILSEDVYKEGKPAKRLRDVLLGRTLPSQGTERETLTFFDRGLNKSQQEAVRCGMDQHEVAVVHGPAGTGKTTTLVELIRQATSKGSRVMVCAPSHTAVDNLLQKVRAAGCRGLVRIGHPADISKAMTDLTLGALSATKAKSENEILKEANIVFGTLMGCSSKMSNLPPGHFALTLVDEGAQALEAWVWAVVKHSVKLVIAGDHCQLQPTVISNSPVVRATLSTSIMERLVGEPRNAPTIRMLTTQYRMADPILQWPNSTFYQGRLRSGPGVGGRALEDLPGVMPRRLPTKHQLLLIDTENTMAEEGGARPAHGKQQGSFDNPGEARISVDIVEQLAASGVKIKDVGIISFYSQQVDRIREKLAERGLQNALASTVDGFQGQEKEVIILSAVRSNKRKNIGFLREQKRLNVAITRAKRLMVIIADRRTLQGSELYKSLFQHIEEWGEVKTIRS